MQTLAGRSDRRFDTRTLVGLSSPTIDGKRLSRRWRCTCALGGAPDLVVTERGVPDSLGIQGLNRGKTRGLKMCLDDVGTSDENRVMLTRATADRMSDPDWSSDSMEGFVSVARASTVQVIAEGVETKFQVDTFRDTGIEMAQGEYFSPPLSADDFLLFFRTQSGAN